MFEKLVQKSLMSLVYPNVRKFSSKIPNVGLSQCSKVSSKIPNEPGLSASQLNRNDPSVSVETSLSHQEGN